MGLIKLIKLKSIYFLNKTNKKEKLNKSDFDLQSLMDQFHSVRALISTISNSLEATNLKVEKNGEDI